MHVNETKTIDMKRLIAIATAVLALLAAPICDMQAQNKTQSSVTTTAAPTTVAATPDSLQSEQKEEATEEPADKYIPNEEELSKRQHNEEITDRIAIIFGLGIPFGAAITIIVIALKTGNRRRQMKYDLIRTAIEHGVQVPEYVFRTQPESNGQTKRFTTAITLIAVGICASLAFIIRGNLFVASLFSIPLVIGIGYLISWYLVRRDERRNAENPSNKSEQQQDA